MRGRADKITSLRMLIPSILLSESPVADGSEVYVATKSREEKRADKNRYTHVSNHFANVRASRDLIYYNTSILLEFSRYQTFAFRQSFSLVRICGSFMDWLPCFSWPMAEKCRLGVGENTRKTSHGRMQS